MVDQKLNEALESAGKALRIVTFEWEKLGKEREQEDSVQKMEKHAVLESIIDDLSSAVGTLKGLVE